MPEVPEAVVPELVEKTADCPFIDEDEVEDLSCQSCAECGSGLYFRLT